MGRRATVAAAGRLITDGYYRVVIVKTYPQVINISLL